MKRLWTWLAGGRTVGPVADPDETCPFCDGEGLVAGRRAAVMIDQSPVPPASPCPVCRGKGTVKASDPDPLE